MGPTSTGTRVCIPTEEKSKGPLAIDVVHKGWTRLDGVLPNPNRKDKGGGGGSKVVLAAEDDPNNTF